MRSAIYIFLVLVGFSSLAFSRTWTRSDGKTVEAEILYFTDVLVALELENGHEFTIPVLELSLEDQAYLKIWEPKRPIEVPEGAVFHEGRWFFRVLEKTTAKKAVTKAEAMGGHLVRIRDQKTQDLVAKIADGLMVWIDGSDEEVEGLWKFSNGEKMEYKNWLKDNPNNYKRRQHHVIIQAEGKWNDFPANNADIVGYIVEWE